MHNQTLQPARMLQGILAKMCSRHPSRVGATAYSTWPYERERERTRHRPYFYARQDLRAPLRAVADPKSVFPTCPETGRFAVFLSPELNFTEGFCSEVPVPNAEKEKDGVLSPSYGVSSHVPSCEAYRQHGFAPLRGYPKSEYCANIRQSRILLHFHRGLSQWLS
jgi:hypothetical protein